MRELKFTDEEIIKALECCADAKRGCEGCPLRYIDVGGGDSCLLVLCKHALNIINRTKERV